MKWSGAVLSAGLAASAMAAGVDDFAVVFPIETPVDSAAWQIELTPEVYSWVRDDGLLDIAVFNSAGLAVPLARMRAEVGVRRIERLVDVPVLAMPAASAARSGTDLRLRVERDADGRLRNIETRESRVPGATAPREWLLDLGAVRDTIDTIQLRWSTPLDGIVARFALEASDDLQRWRIVRSDAAIVLLDQDGTRVERRDIGFAATRVGYLRLRRLDDGTALEGLLAQARIVQSESAQAPLRWLDASLRDGHDAGSTHYEYTLAAAVAAESARVQLGSDNALADLSLSVPMTNTKGEPAWSPRARFVAFRLRQDDSIIDNGDIAIATVARENTFRIESRTPLGSAPRLAIGYRADRVVFLAEGPGPYLLAVGSARERRADAPIETALASLRSRLGSTWQPPMTTLGPLRESAGERAFQAPAEPLDWRRWVLWIVLALGAALVGGIALSLLRRPH